ncbi:MAG: hypothetical protein IKX05_05120 [Bacteroidales bacterium]|nr:hypothetical protein [Bacteroidales bacterium]MBR5064081.1 hypothetical protein [Bacteroidales bacterium]
MKKTLLLIAIVLLGAVVARAQEKKYFGAEKAYVKTITESDSQVTSEQEMWFVDYGRKMKSIITLHWEGMGDYTTVSFAEGDTVYTLGDDGKVIKESEREGLDFYNLSEENIKKYKLKELGTEECFGKECIKYSQEQKVMLSTAKIINWIWGGIVIRSEMKRGRTEAVTRVTELKEDIDLPADFFDIPK